MVTASVVREIIQNSGLVLDAYGMAYLNSLEEAESMYGSEGVRVQILYILNDVKPARTDAQKAAKKQLQKLSKKG